jgi:hypothetical protein
MKESRRRISADYYTAKSWQKDDDAKVYRMNECEGFKATEIALSTKGTAVRNCYDKYKRVYHEYKQTLQYPCCILMA